MRRTLVYLGNPVYLRASAEPEPNYGQIRLRREKGVLAEKESQSPLGNAPGNELEGQNTRTARIINNN
ncbi:hypothetical protein HWI79_3618 [Cryptosporidium felis]|nr:hypothetical protein HWI79_3618 [Cryptosporidium felis]